MFFKRIVSKNKFLTANLCTKTTNIKNKLYSNTILLPKTKFPSVLAGKDKLTKRDETITQVAEFDQLYSWQRSHLSEPEFVLHDGPPYANGSSHMGHAINKILKDIIVRYKLLNGNKVHFVPGWDCHGLPIELKALNDTSNDSTPIEIREKARNYAKNTIKMQEKVFKSWGVLGDWNNSYATYKSNYIKTQLKIFYKLYKKKLIFRDFKPIYWSPSSRTALAEAELEYNENHKSPSAYVRFKLRDFPGHDSYKDNIYALIWTTTPWTLPSNQAICFNPTLTYSLIKKTDNEDTYLVAKDLIEDLSKTFNCNFEILDTFPGETLSKLSYIHPIYKTKIGRFYPSAHATVKKGTGLVHTAPAHGPEDFLIALENKIQIENFVNELGCYMEGAGTNLEGKFVLNEGNQTILQLLGKNLVYLGEYIHSYPYDWRTKKPVIIRASKQWFIDTELIKTRAIELLENVEFIPKVNSSHYKNYLITQINKRPYWCISRQRKWGVPIPVFYDNDNDGIIIDGDIIRHHCELIDKHGGDFWWTLPLNQLIPSNKYESNLTKSEDILDIWFDSGISWANVLEGDKVADMYLEGLDQFSGWFQSSLILSVALRNKLPFKSIYVHGFAVDESGNKMSKSIGNVVNPSDIINGTKKNPTAYGVDVLRWWVACHANKDSMAYVSDNVLQSCLDDVKKIRNVLRFALGALNDYDNSVIDYNQLLLIDKYMLHVLSTFQEDMETYLNFYQFNKICTNTINLLTNQISALYYTSIKDRLYCDLFDSITRRNCQFVLLNLLEVITQILAPIVPHLIEEIYQYLPQKKSKTYFTSNPNSKPESYWRNNLINDVMTVVLDIKSDLNKQMGANTGDCLLNIGLSENVLKKIKDLKINHFEEELEDIFQVSKVNINQSSNLETKYELEIKKTNKYPCGRCRKIQSINENELCKRCNQILKLFDENRKVLIYFDFSFLRLDLFPDPIFILDIFEEVAPAS